MTLNKKLLRKIPFHLAALLLTACASLVLGFLSFGGMYALLPALPLAVGAFILSVAYEGEIYGQNIRSGLKKLFTRGYLSRQVSNQFLLDHFPDTSLAGCPQFFKDYEAQLRILHRFEHKRLDKASHKRKKQTEKTLKDMEKWFAEQFFAKKTAPNATDYARAVNAWLQQQQKTRKDYHFRRKLLTGAAAFSTATGLLMAVGSTYLLVEAFTALPVLASIPFSVLPAIIIPMAIVSGVAYGLLTYNAVTDMITQDTLTKWCKTLYNDIKQNGLGVRNIFMVGLAAFLAGLAITLTLCTAGTWWTIAKHTPPLFTWLAKIPPLVMALIGADGVFFNLVNTKASWDMINDAVKPSAQSHNKHHHAHPKLTHRLKAFFSTLSQKENLLQILNPFRLLLIVAITPIRLVLFLGHLISMGVGDDRVPGLPEIVGASLSTVSEVFEDLHYFFDLVPGGHHHHRHGINDLLKERHSGHNHSHDNDLPTRCVKWLFTPVYLLAASWDYLASKLNNTQRHTQHEETASDLHSSVKTSQAHRRKNLSFKRAWEKQHGIPEKDTVKIEEYGISTTIPNKSKDFDSKTLYIHTKPTHGECLYYTVNPKGQLSQGIIKLADLNLPATQDAISTDELMTLKRKILTITGAKQHTQPCTSDDWKREHALYRLKRHKQKQLHRPLAGRQTAKEKIDKLNQFETTLRQQSAESIHALVTTEANQSQKKYGKHRFFASSGKTCTEQMISDLPQRIGTAPAA